MLFTVVVTYFLFAFCLIYYLNIKLVSRKPMIIRLKKYMETESKKKKGSKPGTDMHRALKAVGDKLAGLIFLKGYRIFLQKELERADLPIKAEELLTIHVILFLVGWLYYPISRNIILSCTFAVILWILPLLVVSSTKKKRIKTLNQQLGDAMVVISNSLKAGYSFLQAVEMVAREMPSPISTEFRKMLREMNLGISTEDALNNLIQRVPSQDLEMMVMAVLIQRQVGGNLAEVIDNISFTIRERVKMKGEIRTLTAQGKISGIVISLLPVVLALAFFGLNPSYINKLFTTIIGLVMLTVGILMQLVGIVLIRKIVNVEV